MRRLIVPLAVVAVLALGVGAGAGSDVASSPRLAQGCAAHDRMVPASARTGATAALVPAAPRLVLLCRYSGLGSTPRSRAAFRLTDDLLVTDRSTVTSLASKLDGLPSFSRGSIACPADFGDAIVAIFGYRSGADDPVRFDLHGCDPVSNGHVTRTAGFAAGQALRGQLEAMTSHTRIGISRKVRAALLNDALRDARNAGDPHPFDIEAVKTTYLMAETLIGPERTNDVAAWEPVYVFAERGRFTAYLATPPGAAPPTGTVQGAILTMSLRTTDGYLNDRYPALAEAGKPDRLKTR